MRALFGIMLLGALIALSACQFVPHPIFPDAIRVTATNDSTSPIATGQLLVGDEVVYAIWVPSAVASKGALLYLEVEVLNPLTEVEITAHNLLGREYAQSSSPYYFSGPIVSGRAFSADGDVQIGAQGIVETVDCRGPCILQPAARFETIYLKIKNTGFDSTNYNLYAFAEAYSDANEPGNNNINGAVGIPVGEAAQGALETLGDVDFYVTAGPVRSIRITGTPGPITVAPTAVLTDYRTGAFLGRITAGTPNDGETFSTPVRVQIRVYSANGRAGPSGSSFYEITTTAP